MARKIIVLVGPTAVGKTEYAIAIAYSIGGEIISADSMQIYKFMDIGSAKPTPEEAAMAKHYLIDEIDPREPFSVAEYSRKAKEYIEKVFSHGKVPIISGGTGLYVNSILYEMDFSGTPGDPDFRREAEHLAELHGNEYLHDMLRERDPAAADRIHPNNRKKVIRALEATENGGQGVRDFKNASIKCEDYEYLLIGLDRPREELYDRINRRVDALISKGLSDEVKQLMTMGLSKENISMMGIGYKELIGHFEGEYDFETAVELIKRNSRRYAKRQLTWFRRYPDIAWFDVSKQGVEDILDFIGRHTR